MMPGPEVWYLRAAEAGHVAAMANLARIYAESGRVSEAESWYRRAMDAGNIDSAMSLIVLLEQNGRSREIPEWMDWGSAASRGPGYHPLFVFAVATRPGIGGNSASGPGRNRPRRRVLSPHRYVWNPITQRWQADLPDER